MTHTYPAPPGRAAWRSGIRWRVAGMIVSGGLVVAGATAVDPARAAVAAPPAATGIDVVVLGEGRGLAAAAVRRSGGTVVRRLPTIAGVTATIPSSALRSLRAASGVTGVTVDRRYELRGESSRGTDPGSSLRDIRALSGVDRLAGEARGGAGVDVAVVDSGVARVDGLDAPDKVVDAPDFSDDRTEPALKGHDGFGHGTHLAGVIAADDENAGLIGMAPDARILDVKVADHAGGTSLSQLLAGIDWVVRNRDRGGLDIRVMNLAFGADVDGASYRTDPLAYAVEQAWRRGIVVVTAAGNGGVDSGGLDSPAHDPYVLAVGATDTAGTVDASDDTIAEFSSAGTSERAPDLAAVGVGVVSLRVPGGVLDEEYPGARIGESWFRGSGTSQAAAVVSGASAVLLEHLPALEPDAVKARLRAGAVPLAEVEEASQGAGALDVAAAADAAVGDVDQRWPVSHAAGSWRARGQITPGLVLERPEASRWSASRWSASRWSASRWSASRWSASRWSASRWSASRWSASRWSASRWSASRWSGAAWERAAE